MYGEPKTARTGRPRHSGPLGNRGGCTAAAADSRPRRQRRATEAAGDAPASMGIRSDGLRRSRRRTDHRAGPRDRTDRVRLDDAGHDRAGILPPPARLGAGRISVRHSSHVEIRHQRPVGGAGGGRRRFPDQKPVSPQRAEGAPERGRAHRRHAGGTDRKEPGLWATRWPRSVSFTTRSRPTSMRPEGLQTSFLDDTHRRFASRGCHYFSFLFFCLSAVAERPAAMWAGGTNGGLFSRSRHRFSASIDGRLGPRASRRACLPRASPECSGTMRPISNNRPVLHRRGALRAGSAGHGRGATERADPQRGQGRAVISRCASGFLDQRSGVIRMVQAGHPTPAPAARGRRDRAAWKRGHAARPDTRGPIQTVRVPHARR